MSRERFPPNEPTQPPVATASGARSIHEHLHVSSSSAESYVFPCSSSDDCVSDVDDVELRSNRGVQCDEGHSSCHYGGLPRIYDESDEDEVMSKAGHKNKTDVNDAAAKFITGRGSCFCQL
ncbi:hypothetical protein GN244_ATG19411 [Phytophthora infestans]|uniref:Uncharacterized protein n=1 Tax=Phytophthora infestans TaxID=4787 RepID=A0A833W448_PHYIN|nr:hypothetical protein GN244_ATG19411 [Phytophthora infestans]